MLKTSTFFMFDGRAEEAMNFYVSVFENSKIENIVYYDPEVAHMQGKVVHGVFTINGKEYIAMDNASGHKHDFTPSVSIFITCRDAVEVDELYAKLSEDGSVMMELNTYDFSPRYAWVNDQFGVSWQLFVAPAPEQ